MQLGQQRQIEIGAIKAQVVEPLGNRLPGIEYQLRCARDSQRAPSAVGATTLSRNCSDSAICCARVTVGV